MIDGSKSRALPRLVMVESLFPESASERDNDGYLTA
jgi:hypothetical protein